MLKFVCVPSEQRGSASESIGTTRS